MSAQTKRTESLIADTTAIIKAFERPRALQRLLSSLKRFYPTMKIIVADDSLREPTVPSGVQFMRLTPDTGASAGRNRMLEQVTTPFFWQLDDDFQLTRSTRFERLAEPVASGQADIVGGDCIRCKRKWFGWVRHKPSPYFGHIRCANGVLEITPYLDAGSGDYLHCDIIPQFFVARTETILGIGGWDEQLKTEEHEEFFVRCQQHGLRTLYCPIVTIRHWSELSANYARFRNRSYRPLAAQKMGVHTWVDMNGGVAHYGEYAINKTAAAEAA